MTFGHLMSKGLFSWWHFLILFNLSFWHRRCHRRPRIGSQCHVCWSSLCTTTLDMDMISLVSFFCVPFCVQTSWLLHFWWFSNNILHSIAKQTQQEIRKMHAMTIAVGWWCLEAMSALHCNTWHCNPWYCNSLLMMKLTAQETTWC